ncbi:hypothetical protein [Microterricola viridarii]|uniref:Uncharacterized protein n=1 Tax=Microterricola viridarii TaxID=412690 RepID=A0A1H1ZN48_9MICO|nr:hypothetical protein [Microterricola viridarii]SDT35124.1 hypothetical protein SAMN04489834_3528 [Microterricola viridarii]
MGKQGSGIEHEVAAEPESPGLHALRQLAMAEIARDIELHSALGEEPLHFLPTLPTLDEQVVLDLRRERCTLPELAAERARAYHPAARPGAAEEFEFGMLRAIALEYPALSGAVWRLLGRAPRQLGRAG